MKVGRYKRGTSHHKAVLGEDDVLLMRALHRGGLSVGQIHRKWDDRPVAWATVWCAVHYHSWRHLP